MTVLELYFPDIKLSEHRESLFLCVEQAVYGFFGILILIKLPLLYGLLGSVKCIYHSQKLAENAVNKLLLALFVLFQAVPAGQVLSLERRDLAV